MSYQGQHTGAEIDEAVSAALAGGTSSGGVIPINIAIYCYNVDGTEWEISSYDAPPNLGELVQAYIENAQSAANTSVADLKAYQWNLYLVGGADEVGAVVTPQYVEVYESFVQLRFSDHQFEESNRQFSIRITTTGAITGHTYSAADA